MMLWIIAIIAVFLLGTGIAIAVMYVKVRSYKGQVDRSLSYLNDERETKEELASACLTMLLGLCDPRDVEDKQKEVALLEENLRTELGKLTIGKAEIEGLYTRVRELDEVQQELEASSLEAAHELEMLRSQEKELADKSAKLREELNKALVRLDKLLEELADSQVAVESLAKAKQEMLGSQEKITWYEEQIVDTNTNYMELKKAYDALDIEYAQLYEKQNM
jgi:chromosome segregation ATPase